MGYKTLRVLSYSQSILNISEEYERRINGESAVKTNLWMSPNERDHKAIASHQIFCVLTPDIYKMTISMMQRSETIKRLISELPDVASDQFFLETLVNELMSTNEIEGVRSTRRELYSAVMSALKKEKTPMRFRSLANIYLGIRRNRSIKITDVTQIRTTWEYVTAGEIKKADLPDGQVFRSKEVFINDAASGRAIHWPSPDEAQVKEDMEALIQFMNDDETPFILKALISHFFFEYVHPFYDGNGRTGRYLACAYLGKKLDYLTGISLSNSISKAKNRYYQAFAEVEHPKNFGDVTFFVETLMRIIETGQKDIITALKQSQVKLEDWFHRILAADFTDHQKAILAYLIQPYLFGSRENSTMDDNALKELLSSKGLTDAPIAKSALRKALISLRKTAGLNWSNTGQRFMRLVSVLLRI
ncbi:Fic family protein [Lacticaseibacillus chiayiensis]|uniref:Fic family protein n=1 Tax=Lacticaseibacillus chiayiensis TaxID=2100821 RepID=UPI001011E2EC|nr:Fic family protein [Lacticaseibacillus chiayiensis]RXT58789.1 hypothetical protein CHT97_04000 [Lacticaseibacillus chiayiensis]